MDVLQKTFQVGKKFNFILLFMILGTSASLADFTGRYCELDGATTDNGESVTGVCYFYSDRYGELEEATTDDGESVTGECYRYSEQYAELEGATTDDGQSVTGECYIY
jgi:hypothetical protein